MDTVVSIEVIADDPEDEVRAALQRALDWFVVVERTCSRFDPASEVRKLAEQAGQPVAVSPVLFQAVRFAVALARRTRGVFDPTVGQLLEQQGFDRHYVTGERAASSIAPDATVSYRDVQLDARRRTITLRRPAVLDLGAVAKGLAIDLAERELAGYANFCIDAGGDLVVRGRNARSEPWQIGVQHPRDPDSLVCTLELTDQAVCTSGDYERRTGNSSGHHLLNLRTQRPAEGIASVTVVAPTALAADGLSTAAFLLGPKRCLPFLERQGVAGIMITSAGDVETTLSPRKTVP
jgi:thiamine biosynthesis lipoprotein